MMNAPEYWQSHLPAPAEKDHKYIRGQVAVLGGVEMTGAACLAADAAARTGAGLVTIMPGKISLLQRLMGDDPMSTYQNFRPYIIVRKNERMIDFVKDEQKKTRRVVPVIGPGLGNKEYEIVRTIILSLLKEEVPLVLDADGLNAFIGYADVLLKNLHKDVILTPHDGEFLKLFPQLTGVLNENRKNAAEQAASLSASTIVLKGAKTIIAAREQETVINDNASPYLATAGSGDVLAGIMAGLVAQGMPPFGAACAGVWIHGRASQIIGAGLVACDIIEKIPEILKETLGIRKKLR